MCRINQGLGGYLIGDKIGTKSFLNFRLDFWPHAVRTNIRCSWNITFQLFEAAAKTRHHDPVTSELFSYVRGGGANNCPWFDFHILQAGEGAIVDQDVIHIPWQTCLVC